MPTEDAKDAAFACAAECAKHRETFRDVHHLSVDELRSMQKPFHLLDVRSEAERLVSTLPGAVALADFKPDGLPVVTFCTVGYRSALEARRLAAAVPGLQVSSFSGVLEWVHGGGALVEPSSGAPTRRLHAFGAKWAAMAPSDFDVVTFSSYSCDLLREVLRLPLTWFAGQQRPWTWGRTTSRTQKDHDE
jgi:rhodanese-related sulfurtransferase